MMFDIDKSLNKMLGKGKQKKKKSARFNYFSEKPLDVNKILIKKKYPKSKDWDLDGVPNWKDCQPRNIMRQDNINFDNNPMFQEKIASSFRFTSDDSPETEYIKKFTFKQNPALQSNFNFKSFSNKEDALIQDFVNGAKPVVDFYTAEGQLQTYLQKFPQLNNYEYIDYTTKQEMNDGYIQDIPNRIYFKPGQEGRANQIVDIYTKYPAVTGTVFDDNYHRNLGRLYGYPENEINAFIMRQKTQQ